nr:hypothetical protein [Planctomycetota bacterium]
MMIPAVRLASIFLGWGIGLFAFAPAVAAQGAQLQIQNGSSQTVDVFWQKDAAERVPNGSVEPGQEILLATTIGHRIVLVPRNDTVVSMVKCEMRVQS